MRIRPDFPVVWREEPGKWWDVKLIEHLIDGFSQAGLRIDDDVQETEPTKTVRDESKCVNRPSVDRFGRFVGNPSRTLSPT